MNLVSSQSDAVCMRPLGILIVEDDEIDFEQLRRFLAGSRHIGQMWRATCLDEALAHLNRNEVDVVVLDLGLPDTHSLESVQAIHRARPDLPIVIVTGHNAEELALEAIAMGAEDYLVKREFHAETFNKSVRYAHQRKKAEERAKQAYKELEEANKELKDMQLQLVQSEKLASIGQLAAGVAHEMNTPVGFVASNFETLEKYVTRILALIALYDQLATSIESGTREDRAHLMNQVKGLRADTRIDYILKDIQELLAGSREGLHRVTDIVQNLRDFSRVDHVEDCAEFDLNAGIEMTLAVARNEIKYNAEVRTELSEIPPLFCNAGYINQVFLNILVNAAQAINSHERSDLGLITVRTYQDGTHVVCEIEDDGPGIPQAMMRKIFDPFFTTKPVGKGTGLGLSISYDIIVNRHGGQLLVDSQEGGGTKFTMRLPIARDSVHGSTEAGQDTGAESNGQEDDTVRR